MAIAIFVMEKELRGLKGRGHFPIPNIMPHGTRVETPHHIIKFLEAVDEEIVHIVTTVRESDRDYEKEKGLETNKHRHQDQSPGWNTTSSP